MPLSGRTSSEEALEPTQVANPTPPPADVDVAVATMHLPSSASADAYGLGGSEFGQQQLDVAPPQTLADQRTSRVLSWSEDGDGSGDKSAAANSLQPPPPPPPPRPLEVAVSTPASAPLVMQIDQPSGYQSLGTISCCTMR